MSFSITILGSGGALPLHGRYPSSQLIILGNRHFLVDCGEGTQTQLRRYNLSLHRIGHIFISHLHGDHYLGLMGLIYTMHLEKRTSELHIYSHRGLEEIIMVQLRHSSSVLQFPLIFHPLQKDECQVIYENNEVFVQTIPLLHKIRCSGFLFKEKEKLRRIDKSKLPPNLLPSQFAMLKQGKDITDHAGAVLFKNNDLTTEPRPVRSYAYCSDTAYQPAILPIINNVDLLYHEATFSESDLDKAIETKHSTAKQAAQIASKANAKKLLIGHFSARYKDLDILLSEARSLFPHTDLAEEGKTFHIQE